MSLIDRLTAVVQAIGADIKDIREKENVFVQQTRPTTTVPGIWIETVGPNPKDLRVWVINR